MSEGSVLARLVGGAGCFFTGMGIQVLIVIPENEKGAILEYSPQKVYKLKK